MARQHRRQFLKTLAAAATVTLAGTKSSGRVLGANEVCITSSTRNFKGRMGSPSARIYMGSSATVAASAIAGHITDPTPYLGDDR